LAKQHHPDANRNDPQAEARFKEINEAYEVLGDKDKRAMYDRYGTVNPQEAGYNAGAGRPGGSWTYTNSGQPVGQPGGQPADMGDLSDFFDSIFGGRRSSRTNSGAANSAWGRPQRGEDIEQPVTISLREAFSGTNRTLIRGDRRINVVIPAGAATGTKVRLEGEGEAGLNGAKNGDLLLIVEVEPDPQFERKGDDLQTELKIDMFTALLGGEIEVPTLRRPVKLKIPAGTQSGRRFRVPGKGMPVLRQVDQHGDLYVRIAITIPEHLTPEQRALVEQLKATFA
jgi:curved DNA-binding protein